MMNVDHLRTTLIVGSFITLPLLPSGTPKLMSPNEREKFYLSQHRVDLVNEMIESRAQNYDEDKNGMVISGPHGVGKSAVLYLMNCVAWARSWYVVYIPTCLQWCQNTKEKCEIYFLEQVWLMNYDILNEEQRDELNDLVQINFLPVKGISMDPLLIQDIITGNFKHCKDTPILYSFDEHNELYREHIDNNRTKFQHSQSEYFQNFNLWTGCTKGLRTFTIYAGSAHSTFESSLPSGEEVKIRFIQPLDLNELKEFVSKSKLFPEMLDVNWLYEITGGVLRRVSSFFGNSQEILDYVHIRKTVMHDTLTTIRKEWIKMENNGNDLNQVAKELLTLIDSIRQDTILKERPFHWYDAGVCYQSSKGKFSFVSLIAQQACETVSLQQLFGKDNTFPKDVDATSVEIKIRRRICSTNIKCLTHYFIGPMIASPAPIEWNICTCLSLGDVNFVGFNLKQFNAQLKYTDVLLQPSSKQFPAWDFVVVKANTNKDGNPSEVCFVQVSVSGELYINKNVGAFSMDSAHRAKLSTNGDRIAQNILHKIGLNNASVTYSPDGEFITKTCNNVIVRFLFITKAKVTATRTQADGNSPAYLKNMEVIGSVELESKFGLKFS
jgi:hypothetical protein